MNDPRRPVYYIENDAGQVEPKYDYDKSLLDHRWQLVSVRPIQLGGGSVSTVFLGIDHNYASGPPILWETMIFGVDRYSDWQWRYTSRANAIAGHNAIAKMFFANDVDALDAWPSLDPIDAIRAD